MHTLKKLEKESRYNKYLSVISGHYSRLVHSKTLDSIPADYVKKKNVFNTFTSRVLFDPHIIALKWLENHFLDISARLKELGIWERAKSRLTVANQRSI